jgi:hypothetical protein
MRSKRGEENRGERRQHGVSFCLSQIVWRCGGVGMCEGAGLRLSLKPWTSSKAQTEKDGQGKDGVEGGLEVAQLAQG